jgi:EmrB/QacA subfamily drug resistance transporter
MPTVEPTAVEIGPPGDGALEHREIRLILIGLMSGMFLSALDQTIMASAIRTVADDLDGLSLQAWATTAYLITSTIATPLYGKLSDIYGRRQFFIFAIVVFVLGSALCGAATSMTQLAMYRGLQGVGAGGLFSLALTIIGDIVPPRERARYQGYFLAVFGTSSVLGPVIGGFLAGRENLLGFTGWRWVFLVNIPIGVVSLFLVARWLHLPHHRNDHRIDWPGALSLGIGLVPLLIVAEQGREWGWTSGTSMLCYGAGVLGLMLFILAERMYGDEALLPLRLFANKTYAIGTMLNFALGLGMFGAMAAYPLYLQIVKGFSPTEAGLLLLPMTAGIMSASVTTGQIISRTGRYKVFPVVGLTLMIIGIGLTSRANADTSILIINLYGSIFGFGLGCSMQPLVLAIQNTVPPQDMGVATSSVTFFRQMGGTLGTAVFLSVLFGSLPGRIRDAFGQAAGTESFRSALRDPAVLADPANRPVIQAVQAQQQGEPIALADGVMNDSSFIHDLDSRLARPFLVGFAGSISEVFLLGCVILMVAFVIVWFLPEEPLRNESGIQARRSAQVAEAAEAAETARADEADRAAQARTGIGGDSRSGTNPSMEEGCSPDSPDSAVTPEPDPV